MSQMSPAFWIPFSRLQSRGDLFVSKFIAFSHCHVPYFKFYLRTEPRQRSGYVCPIYQVFNNNYTVQHFYLLSYFAMSMWLIKKFDRIPLCCQILPRPTSNQVSEDYFAVTFCRINSRHRSIKRSIHDWDNPLFSLLFYSRRLIALKPRQWNSVQLPGLLVSNFDIDINTIDDTFEVLIPILMTLICQSIESVVYYYYYLYLYTKYTKQNKRRVNN